MSQRDEVSRTTGRVWYFRDKFGERKHVQGLGNKIPVTQEEDEWFGEKYPSQPSMIPESASRIKQECDRIKAFLVEKNLAYGDSALSPVRVFSQASTVEQLLVRIDDKLSRMQRGFEFGNDDTTLDLIGYLILLRIALENERDASS